MVAFDSLVAACLGYVALLFAVAFMADRRARRAATGAAGWRWLSAPLVYTLSLSIYCTAWTFYGAVGNAARTGLDFVTIYLGPTLVFVGWLWVLRKLVRIGRTERVTSIADLLSSRYGKSNLVGVIVTVIAVAAATPYIALQLQSVTLSFGVFAAEVPGGWAAIDRNGTAFWVAAGLALFTTLFGTRNLDANERHHGVVTAIAVEAVVKLVALLAVGSFVVWGVAGGIGPVLARIDASPVAAIPPDPGRWIGLTMVSAAAVLTLPRMFQVMVVENAAERHLGIAAWAFPLYLLAMSLFVLPIAVVGLDVLPAGSNPDLFVVSLPLALDRERLAMLAFLGGFSSATSMVIVESIALATMVSNHIVTPLWLAFSGRLGAGRVSGPKGPGDVRGLVLMSRRLSIAGIMALGYAYYAMSGGGAALSAIGLIAFVGVAQMLPAMLGGLYWRGATRAGAAAGLVTGFGVWLYALYLPSFGPGGLMPPDLLAQGPWGIGWLRPQALFGSGGLDPVLHAMVWSMILNSGVFVTVSLATFPGPVERMQGLAFVRVFDGDAVARGWSRGLPGGGAEAEDLLAMAQGILGTEAAQAFFRSGAERQGKAGFLPDMTPAFIEALERQLAGAVGSATAHAMIAQFAEGAAVTAQDLMAVASEAQQIIEYSAALEAKSDELERTARQLREANEKLTELSVQKDGFLSQVSHELRTPMTSIRAFSEILMEDGLPDAMRAEYAKIIHTEAIRLTRLLDDLLDLSVLENRGVRLTVSVANLHDLIGHAVTAASRTGPERDFRIDRDELAEHVPVFTDTDRLTQVFINLVSNARKYCDAERPVLRIEVRRRGPRVEVDFIDNGRGIPKKAQSVIFEKFVRLSGGETTREQALPRGHAGPGGAPLQEGAVLGGAVQGGAVQGGAGLGLAICREIMANLGGSIAYLPGQGGAAFRVTLPVKGGVRRAA
jgi:Na+/proline symporter/signal transduction histidine kinase